jgi:hypothetical protein
MKNLKLIIIVLVFHVVLALLLFYGTQLSITTGIRPSFLLHIEPISEKIFYPASVSHEFWKHYLGVVTSFILGFIVNIAFWYGFILMLIKAKQYIINKNKN